METWALRFCEEDSMTKAVALDLLSKYVCDVEDIPFNRYQVKKYVFLNDCYIRWAFDEIEDYLLKHDRSPIGTDAFAILEEFANKMNDFACKAKTEDASFIFATAYDVVQDFIGFCVMEEGGF